MATISIGRGMHAIVDVEDLPRLRRFRWGVKGRGSGRLYARTGMGGVTLMHRFLMNAPDGMDVDHINGDGLDNRKENLRVCTHIQNMWNRKLGAHGFKGINFCDHSKVWRARIRCGDTTHDLGCFHTVTEAARAYDAAAIRLHGEFARLNFPNG